MPVAANAQPPVPRPPHPAALRAAVGPGTALCALLWSLRHQLQDMTAEISADELEKFGKSLAFHGQDPVIRFTPFHSGLAIQMVDRETGVAITQSESTEEDQKAKERAAAVRAAVNGLPQLLSDYRSLRAAGNDSDDLFNELVAMAETMRAALR